MKKKLLVYTLYLIGIYFLIITAIHMLSGCASGRTSASSKDSTVDKFRQEYVDKQRR